MNTYIYYIVYTLILHLPCLVIKYKVARFTNHTLTIIIAIP